MEKMLEKNSVVQSTHALKYVSNYETSMGKNEGGWWWMLQLSAGHFDLCWEI